MTYIKLTMIKSIWRYITGKEKSDEVLELIEERLVYIFLVSMFLIFTFLCLDLFYGWV
jgi:hypothetical protein